MNTDALCPAIINISTALIYISDLKTHELYFLNKTFLDFLGNPPEEKWKGKKCYKILQNKDEPCEFCRNKVISEDKSLIWTHYNAITKKYFSMQDRLLLAENNKQVHLTIAHDITDIYRVLSQKEILSGCIEMLHSNAHPENAVNILLKNLTDYYKADRAYVFKYSDDKQFISNTYEYCHTNTLPQMEFSQNIPSRFVQLWKERFKNEDGVYVGSTDLIKVGYLDDCSDEYKCLYQNRKAERVIAIPLTDKEKEIVGFIGVDNPRENVNLTGVMRSVGIFIADFLDKTEFFTKELDKFTYKDALTGTNNRYSYAKKLDDFKTQPPKHLGIIYIDINGLKTANAEKGYEHGDAILLSLTKLLEKYFSNFIYRVNGDEFLVLDESTNQDDFKLNIEKFKDNIKENAYFTVSIGSLWTEDCSQVPSQIERANALLFVDKQEYYKSKELNIKYQTVLLNTLQDEIKNETFCVYFQPQVDLKTLKVIGAETLIRKIDEDGSVILPAYFIPLYEKFGIINQIDFYVFETVCKTLEKWENEYNNTNFTVSVNFSRHSLTHPVIVSHLCEFCRKYNVNTSRIIIEITETVEHVDKEQQLEIINEFAKNGFSISLDDFGTGYSNLSILADVKFDEVKIDKSLIDTITNSEKSQSLVKSVLTVCGDLKIPHSIAEGIESQEQYAILKSLNCEKGQGFLFGRPVPIEDFERKYIMD